MRLASLFVVLAIYSSLGCRKHRSPHLPRPPSIAVRPRTPSIAARLEVLDRQRLADHAYGRVGDLRLVVGDVALTIAARPDTPGHRPLMGAIVDAVEEVVQLSEAELEPPPDFGGSPKTDYILGMATIHGGVKTLLDLDRVFLTEGLSTLAPPQTQNSKEKTI
jgi:hypothetical protein